MQQALSELKAQNQQLREQVEAQNARIAELEALTAQLSDEKRRLLDRIFGRKSEQIDPRQLELLLGLQVTEEAPAPEAEAPPARRPRRPARRRKPRMPEDLPVEEHRIDPDEVKADPDAFVCIGEEITEELEYTGPRYFQKRTIRGKYVSKEDRSRPPLVAPLPPRLIPGGYAGIGLLTDIVLKRFLEHLPLYRQEQTLKWRYGIEISRKSMCDWLEQIAWWLKPIYNHIGDQLRSGCYLQIDETPIRYCRAEGGGSGQGRLWAYHRPGAEVLYEWHTSRAADCLGEMLGEFGGTVQSDGYRAYQSYVRERARKRAEGEDLKPIDLACCWAHARRKFYEAREECPAQAGWMLRQIGLLYEIERRLRKAGAGPALRHAVRTAESAMIVDRIGRMLRLKLPAHRPASQMGKAISYTLSLWEPLGRFVENGRLEIDTNLVENAIRPTAIGKKNWLFIGHPDAGDRTAVIYTILENCKRTGINPEAYLKDVLSRLPSMTNRQTRELTPANWAAAQPKAQAA